MKLLHLLLLADFQAPPGLGGPATFGDLVGKVTNTLLIIAGAVAVIVIVIGGIQYTLSAGDEKRTKTAKDTITNAVIGLVIAIMAFAIVNFVLGTFK